MFKVRSWPHKLRWFWFPYGGWNMCWFSFVPGQFLQARFWVRSKLRTLLDFASCSGDRLSAVRVGGWRIGVFLSWKILIEGINSKYVYTMCCGKIYFFFPLMTLRLHSKQSFNEDAWSDVNKIYLILSKLMEINLLNVYSFNFKYYFMTFCFFWILLEWDDIESFWKMFYYCYFCYRGHSPRNGHAVQYYPHTDTTIASFSSQVMCVRSRLG